MEIKHSYLMWIGSEHYPTFKDWEKEAVERGASKRLPTAGLARKLMEPGTAIFVAHNEGAFHECADCLGTIECPECRRRATAITRLEDEYEAANGEEEGPRRDKKLNRLSEALSKARGACESCGEAEGKGTLEAGTGGRVQYALGVYGDYRTYNYWLHRPKAFAEMSGGETIDTQVSSKEMCEACGGTGKLPDAKVYGLFVPEGIEYILKEGDTEAFKAELGARGIRTVSALELRREAKRGCGYRKPGGYYVVTSDKSYQEYNAKFVADLVEQGIVSPEGVDLSGVFVRFIEPVAVAVKKFRGIKKWALDVEAEAEAEMILDALD